MAAGESAVAAKPKADAAEKVKVVDFGGNAMSHNGIAKTPKPP